MTERPDRTSAFEGQVATSDDVLQVGVVALNQRSQGVLGDVHALRDGLHQVALARKTHRGPAEPLYINLRLLASQNYACRSSYFKAVVLFVSSLRVSLHLLQDGAAQGVA